MKWRSEVEEPAVLEHALEQDAERRHRRRGVGRAVDRAPGLEPLLAGAERPDARLRAVRHDEDRVRPEQRRDLRLVRAELVEGGPDGRRLVGRVLELDHGDRQAVEEQDDVGPALLAALDHRELVDRDPVVGGRVLEVDDAGLRPGDRAVGAAVLHRHAVDEHPVQRPVPLEQRRQRDAGQLAERLLDRLGRQARVQPGERAPEPALEDDVAVPGVGPLGAGRADGDLGAVRDGPAEPVEPGERRLLDDGLEGLGAHRAPAVTAQDEDGAGPCW